jgi:uncharacterized membrane protein (UPF0127 family)
MSRALRVSLALVGLISATSCGQAGPVREVSAERPAANDPPRAEVPVPPRANQPTVVFTTVTGEVAVRVEVARTSEARQLGLMHRRELAAGHGMLFLMPDERVQAFWMRNTLIPLDMIFINRAGVVVGVVAMAEPLTETPRQVDAPSLYVVEIPGGHAALMGIGTGSRMRANGVPELAR